MYSSLITVTCSFVVHQLVDTPPSLCLYNTPSSHCEGLQPVLVWCTAPLHGYHTHEEGWYL